MKYVIIFFVLTGCLLLYFISFNMVMADNVDSPQNLNNDKSILKKIALQKFVNKSYFEKWINSWELDLFKQEDKVEESNVKENKSKVRNSSESYVKLIWKSIAFFGIFIISLMSRLGKVLINRLAVFYVLIIGIVALNVFFEPTFTSLLGEFGTKLFALSLGLIMGIFSGMLAVGWGKGKFKVIISQIIGGFTFFIISGIAIEYSIIKGCWSAGVQDYVIFLVKASLASFIISCFIKWLIDFYHKIKYKIPFFI